ncbi:hypothetical protein BJ878DRAFT_323165 [Calycina marina]|uniref:Flavin-containing monooxygenase n=1 Tax=Calycina marina TaxID=1763456 RepID=A0A9P7Z5W7_9HELO|nr:hypothetical protein BJ878DRAFT_323165 [Calycina marina]
MSNTKLPRKLEYGRKMNEADVLIVGAGISGMCVAIDMVRKGLGRNFIIVEKGNQVGGTWNDQRYPGCCCDVMSHLYSLSFEPNPNWSHEFSGQEEILEYLVRVAHKYELYRHIRFNTEVSAARWDAPSNTWLTTIKRTGSKDAEFGEEYTMTSDFLVSGVGQLNIPRYPDIEGLSSFKGKTMHTARWDWDYDLTDKKIGIIGNGATAAQVIPEIAKVCKSLTIFQRTPNWMVPRNDAEISTTRKAVFKYLPYIRSKYRALLMDFGEEFFNTVFYPDSEYAKTVKELALQNLADALPGKKYAALRETLTPNYAPGCKRIISSDDFYPTLTKDNVQMETTGIQCITENDVEVAGDKEHELDVLILATGFQTTQFMHPIKIYGIDGVSIEDVWKGGASAYLGMTVPQLPNFGMLYGPNTNLGHNSIILMIEAQALYITTLINKVQTAREAGMSVSIRPKAKVLQEYSADIQARLATSAFADPNCHSWYKTESGLVTNNWADAVIPYQKRTSSINWEDFDIGGLGASDIMKEGKTSWNRVVEESWISNTTLLAGIITAGSVTAAGVVYRNTLRRLWKQRAF